MRKYIFLFLALTVAANILRCGGGNEPGSRMQRRGARGASPNINTGPGSILGNGISPYLPNTNMNGGFNNNTNQLTGSQWGKVIPQAGQISLDAQSPGNFQANTVVRWFLSTDYAAQDVGATTFGQDELNKPCQNMQSCGVALCLGSTCGQSGGNHQPLRLAGSNGNQGSFMADGGIAIGFWDSLTGTMGPEGEPYSPIPMFVPIDPNNSYIQNGQVVLTFRDQAGDIQLTGSVQNNMISGRIDFVNRIFNGGGNMNNNNFSGGQQSGGARGTLGTFQIPLCSAINCQ